MEWGRPPSATLGPALWVDYAPKERQNDFVIWVPNDCLRCHKIGWGSNSITVRIGYCNSQKFAYSACFNKKAIMPKVFEIWWILCKVAYWHSFAQLFAMSQYPIDTVCIRFFRPIVRHVNILAARRVVSLDRRHERGALGGMAAKKVVTATWWPVVAV